MRSSGKKISGNLCNLWLKKLQSLMRPGVAKKLAKICAICGKKKISRRFYRFKQISADIFLNLFNLLICGKKKLKKIREFVAEKPET